MTIEKLGTYTDRKRANRRSPNIARLLASAFVAVAGCGSSSQDAPDVPDAPPPTPKRTIRVSRTIHNHGTKGVTDQAFGNPILTVLERDANGTFRSIGFDNGGLGPATVQAGDGLVYLQLIDGGYIVDPRDDYDADIDQAGRVNLTLDRGPLIVGGDGLAPWQRGDSIQIACPSLPTYEYIDTAQLSVDATTFGPITLDDVEIDAGKGDEIWAVQTRDSEVESVVYSHVVRVLHKTDLGPGPGPGGDAQGTFLEPASESLDLDLRLSQFAQVGGVALDQLNANASLEVLPYGRPEQVNVNTVQFPYGITQLSLSRLTADRAISLPYGDPYPATWSRYVRVDTDTARKDYALPGTQPFLLGGRLSVSAPLAEAEAGPIVPLIGPVQDIRIDGKPITPTTIAQASPTVSWTPPALGTAAGYQAGVFEVYAEPSTNTIRFTSLRELGWFTTVEPRVQLPPDLLQPGGIYIVSVIALAGTFDFRSSLRKVTGSHGSAGRLSDTFTR